MADLEGDREFLNGASDDVYKHLDFERIADEAHESGSRAPLSLGPRPSEHLVCGGGHSNVIRLECTPLPEDATPALGQVLVKATSAEMGDNVGQLDASVRGNAGQSSFNGRYLRDALEVIGSPQVDLQLTGD